jgi:hypothetical protein
MTLTQDLLAQVVDDVLETFVGGLADEPQPADTVLPVTAFVQITGGWTGAVLFSCSAELASTVTAAMLALPAEELTQDDISLPTVIFGASGASVPGTELLHRVDRTCAGQPLRVTVLAADPSHAGSSGHVARALAGR